METSSRKQTIDRYEIHSHLDSGGMGDVYKAFDPRFKRFVALKQLPIHQSFNTSKLDRFKLELETIASLEDDAIIPVYDTGNEGNIHYFVMKLVEGGTLKSRIPKNGMLLTDVITLFQRIGPALDKAHSRGIYHRDLKPSNILFDKEEKAYISDFGIAKVENVENQLSGSKNVLGTFPYMSPEQCESKKITAQTDIYALGIILYEMLTGQMPYECNSTLEWMIAHVSKPPFQLNKYRSDIPIQLEEIVSKALEKDPQNRYRSVGEMVSALESVPIPQSSFFQNYKRLLPFLFIPIIIAVIFSLIPSNNNPFIGQPTETATATFTPTLTRTSTPTHEPTPIVVAEGTISVLEYSESAIYQIGDGPLERIPENGQLSVPLTGERLLFQSNAGNMELRLADRTRLFLDQNSTVEILEIFTSETPNQETQIKVDQGLVAVINDETAVTIITPHSVDAELNRGLIEVNTEDSTSNTLINIDCIEQTCEINSNDETAQTLQQGESITIQASGEETITQEARYALYNNIIAGLVITPTPKPTNTPTSTPTIPPSPTPFGSSTIPIGLSNNSTPIEAVQFGHGPVNIFFIGGIHAGLAPSTVTLAKEVINYFEGNPEEVPPNVTIHIIPNLNPDSPLDVGERNGRYNANGVDLNRNWGCDHTEDPIIGGDVLEGRGGPEPFSEPETAALRDYVFEKDPVAIVFWMATSRNGAISPGACDVIPEVSGDLAQLYSDSANYFYESNYEESVGFRINGDAMNYLDDQGYPTIAVLLPDFVDPDVPQNLEAVRSVLQTYKQGYFDQTYVPDTAVPDEIVFQSNRDGDFEIFIMNTNGSNQRQLTFNEEDDSFPRVSPDGRRIVFESERDGNAEIYMMNRDGSNPQRLTNNPGSDRLPSWSADGQKIIYHAFTPELEKSEIFEISLASGEISRVTNTPEIIEAHVSLSSQGQLLFNAKEEISDSWEIFVANSNGTNPVALTNNSINDWSAEWSADGEQIVFLSARTPNASSGIYLMNADGSSVQLLYEDGDAWGPAWSADQQQIIFTIDQEDNTADIYSIDVNNPNNIQFISERGSYPSWAIGIDRPGFNPLPTPTVPPNPTSETITSNASCVENVLNRWENNIYPEFAGRLGCPTSAEKQLTGVFQVFENGLMVWRGDNNSIYVIYTNGPAINSYGIYSMDDVASASVTNPLLKGAIGQLWTSNGVVQSQLGQPRETEMGMSDFTLQEFLRGTIFYFNENFANTYLLVTNPSEFQMIQEK